MKKDFLGREVNVGDYFAYPLTLGRSATMALYKLISFNESGSVKACKICSSYGGDTHRYMMYDYKILEYRDMTEAERIKLDSKTSTLNHFESRACKVEYKEKE
jgi:hypothetical protein